MKKLFKHQDYKEYSDRYQVSDNGEVVNLFTGNQMTQNINASRGQRFVRLSGGKGNALSIGLAKLMLLTFSPESYFKGAIAIHLDADQSNNSRSNLMWGTRKMQSKISMSNPRYKRRVRLMAKKYHKREPKLINEKKVVKLRLSGLTGRLIAKQVGCHEVTVGAIMKRAGYKTIGGKLVEIRPKKN
ncbi:MAG: hypothetical protein ABI855_07950 [Bacteroidota bacterium]